MQKILAKMQNRCYNRFTGKELTEVPERTYLAIDLKSFYASVECIERGLNPMTTNLVVADASRTEKTICLAVSPSLKSYGIPGRPRLFEVLQKVKEINLRRAQRAPGHRLTGSSSDNEQLKISPELGLDFIIAPPRMAHYMQVSTQIYDIYLKYIAPEDIHVYSIDEVLIDVTGYLQTYRLSAYDLAMKMILDVVRTTGITATAGIGPNLYLAKVALDIGAKHIQPDENGVRIACLDEMSYRRTLWTHRPLTDFWRVGRGYARKLEAHGMCTMGDIARCSIGKPSDYYNEDFLYKMFGVNAELLIDHAWGWEPCTIADIKAYKPESNSVGSGQVLSCPYSCQMARLVVHEMADSLALELVDQHLVTDQLVLTIGYDIENLKDPQRRRQYHGQVSADRYGRAIPKHTTGTVHLDYTSSARKIVEAALELFDQVADAKLTVRRLNLTANHVVDEAQAPEQQVCEQLDFFTDYGVQKEEEQQLQRERRRQQAVLSIKKKFGKNAILKGMNLEEGATARDRNDKIGGHKA